MLLKTNKLKFIIASNRKIFNDNLFSNQFVLSDIFNSHSHIRLINTQSVKVNLAYDLNDKFNSDKALIIGHGLFGSKANWRALSRRINEHTKQKIYTIDMRNHGSSLPYVDQMTYIDMANDLKLFIENIKQNDKCKFITLMGHSMGGKAAMCLALTYPELIDRLIVADIAPTISPALINIPIFLNKMMSIDMNSISNNLTQARKQVDQKLCELEALKNDPAQRAYLISRLTVENDKTRWHFNISSIKNHINDIMGFPEFKTKFEKPTLFIGGELSGYITEKDKPMIRQYFPNYKLATIPRAGHVIHFDNPADTIKTVDDFINS